MSKNNLNTSLQQDGRQRNIPAVCAAIFAALLLCLGFSLATAPGAAAHDQIVSTNPTPGEQLAASPTDLEFIFSNSLMSLGNEVRVMDARDKDWASGTPALSGEKMTQLLATGMPDGEYLIRWRVVSSDGHPISGTQTFRVGTATAVAEPTLSSQSNKETTGTTGATAPSSPNVGPGTAGDAAGTAVAGTDGSVLAKVAPLGIGAAIGLGAYLAFVVIGRARKNSKQTP